MHSGTHTQVASESKSVIANGGFGCGSATMEKGIDPKVLRCAHSRWCHSPYASVNRTAEYTSAPIASNR